MEEDWRRHLPRQGIHRIGCVWVFISMFDFRHVGSVQKLLADKKRGSKRMAGNGNLGKKPEEPSCFCEDSLGILDGEDGVVKKLSEEEICAKKAMSDAEKLQKIFDSGSGGPKNDEHPVVSFKIDETNGDYGENLRELIKGLVTEKCGEIQRCKELLEAFQESFQESLGSSQRTEEHLKIVEGSVVVYEEVVGAASAAAAESSEMHGRSMKRKFFNKKARSREKSSLIQRSSSQVSNTTVVLKPGSKNLDVGSSTSNNAKRGPIGSLFLLSGIKRRLKSVIRKKPCDVPTTGASVREANREEEGHASENLKNNNTSRIYVEAKKHLSEILTNGGTDVSLSSNAVPRILGRILSLPELSSPEDSPGRTQGHDFINVESNIREDLADTLSQMSEMPKIQQCGSEGYYEPLELGSDDLVAEDPEKLDENLSASDIDDDTLEMHNEERAEERFEQETFKESKTPFSPLDSPPSSTVRMTECRESDIHVPGKTSPISVLEPPVTEDDISPTSTRLHFVGIQMQPLCIKCNEPDAPEADNDKGNNAKTTTDEKESILAYIKSVVKASGLNREELCLKSFHNSDQLLELPLTDDIEFHPNQLCNDEKLLFDCVNEVLMDLCGPWISSVKLISDIEDVVKDVQERVYWHLIPLPFPHTLDQIVRKDMTKTGNWMDLQSDIACIGTNAVELILEELLEEIVRNCINVYM